jgi:hypothetical protein
MEKYAILGIEIRLKIAWMAPPQHYEVAVGHPE